MPDASRARSLGLLVFLSVCFLLSGATALVYEIVWARYLNLVFGATTWSITTVLVAYMTGLGLGAVLGGRRIDRGGHPLRSYGVLEVGIGVYALLTPWILDLSGAVYLGVARHAELGLATGTALKFLLAMPVLTIPATAMGATLPILVRFITAARDDAQRSVGLLYALNTVGATVGTFAAGFILLEQLGPPRSLQLAAAINIAVGVAAILWARGYAADPEVEEEALSPEAARWSAAQRFAVGVFALSGFIAMLGEVAMSRLMALVIGSSTYAFTVILCGFLLGIAGGAALVPPVLRHRRADLPDLALVLAANALALGVIQPLFLKLPMVVAAVMQVQFLPFEAIIITNALLALCVAVPVAVCGGAMFPLVIDIVLSGRERVGREVGRAYAANTLGSIAGSAITGFFLVDALGTQGTLRLGCFLAGVAAAVTLVLALRSGGARLRSVLAAPVALLGLMVGLGHSEWPPTALDHGVAFDFMGKTIEDVDTLRVRLAGAGSKVVYAREGRNTTVTVRASGGEKFLRVNGKTDATSRGDMATQIGIATLGLQYLEKAPRVFVLGYGSGSSAIAAARYDDVEQVDVVELEEAVVEAARVHFPLSALSGGEAASSKLRVIVDDGRTVLTTAPEPYDFIVSQPSNPWIEGVANLFSEDFYRLARGALREDGVFLQWMQTYKVRPETFDIVLNTFAGSFEHVALWYCSPADLVLVGSRRPLTLSPEMLRRRYAPTPGIEAELRRVFRIESPEEILSRYLVGDAALRALLAQRPAPHHSDDRPVLEYRAARDLYEVRYNDIFPSMRAYKWAQQDFAPDGYSPAPDVAGVGLAGLRATWFTPGISEVWLDDIAAKAPSDPRVQTRLVERALAQGRLAEARRRLETLDAPRAGLLRVQLELRAGRPAVAAEALAPWLDPAPDPALRAEIASLRAALAQVQGDSDALWSASIEYLEALRTQGVLKTDDARRESWRRVAAGSKGEKAPAGIAALAPELAVAAWDAGLRRALARVHAEQGQVEQAWAHLAELAALRALDPEDEALIARLRSMDR